MHEQHTVLVRNPKQLCADALLVAQCRRREGGRIVICDIEVRCDDALQGEVAREQDGVRFKSRRALRDESVEYLASRQQFAAQRALRITADDELGESQSCEQHGEHECRERQEDLGPQAAACPESYCSHLEPRIAGRERASASERWNVSSTIARGQLHLLSCICGFVTTLRMPREEGIGAGLQAAESKPAFCVGRCKVSVGQDQDDG